jgi:hypothetical protein
MSVLPVRLHRVGKDSFIFLTFYLTNSTEHKRSWENYILWVHPEIFLLLWNTEISKPSLYSPLLDPMLSLMSMVHIAKLSVTCDSF